MLQRSIDAASVDSIDGNRADGSDDRRSLVYQIHSTKRKDAEGYKGEVAV
jgi:hypothetical protein